MAPREFIIGISLALVANDLAHEQARARRDQEAQMYFPLSLDRLLSIIIVYYYSHINNK